MNKIVLTIEIGKGKKLSDLSITNIEKEIEALVTEYSELYTKDDSGLAGSGMNFLTNTRDYHLVLGFDN